MSSLSLTLFFSLVSLCLIAILKNWRVWGIAHVKIPVTEALHSQRRISLPPGRVAGQEFAFLLTLSKRHPNTSMTPTQERGLFQKKPSIPGQENIPSQPIRVNLVIYSHTLLNGYLRIRELWEKQTTQKRRIEMNKETEKEKQRWCSK